MHMVYAYVYSRVYVHTGDRVEDRLIPADLSDPYPALQVEVLRLGRHQVKRATRSSFFHLHNRRVDS